MNAHRRYFTILSNKLTFRYFDRIMVANNGALPNSMYESMNT